MTVWFTGRLSSGADELAFDSDDLVTDPDAIFSVTDLNLDGAPSWVKAAFAAGTLVVELTLTGDTDSSLTTGLVVYDVFLTDKGTAVLANPAARQFPRDDDLGIGSAVRQFPPLRSGRIAGGFQ